MRRLHDAMLDAAGRIWWWVDDQLAWSGLLIPTRFAFVMLVVSLISMWNTVVLIALQHGATVAPVFRCAP